MSDRTIEDQKAHVNSLLNRAGERDAFIEGNIRKEETAISYSASDKEKRRGLMKIIIDKRERQVKRWRDIIREIETLDARLQCLGDHMEARSWRRVRDTFAAKLEDGEEDLITRQTLFSRLA